MRHYLYYSSAAHFLFLAALFLIVPRNPLQSKKNPAYYMDFIGASAVVNMRKAEPASGGGAPAAVKSEKPDEDDFSGGALPKPSVLSGAAKLFDAPKPGEETESRAGAELVTDSENFPYPWYIAQVRETLWNAWTGKMPSGGNLRCTVRFAIRRNGAIKGASVEKSSGNRLFDYAAEASVQSAAPFPPLPEDFYEDTLTVHVEFKAMD